MGHSAWACWPHHALQTSHCCCLLFCCCRVLCDDRLLLLLPLLLTGHSPQTAAADGNYAGSAAAGGLQQQSHSKQQQSALQARGSQQVRGEHTRTAAAFGSGCEHCVQCVHLNLRRVGGREQQCAVCDAPHLSSPSPQHAASLAGRAAGGLFNIAAARHACVNQPLLFAQSGPSAVQFSLHAIHTTTITTSLHAHTHTNTRARLGPAGAAACAWQPPPLVRLLQIT